MNYIESVLPEFDREMANTRKVLERVPEDKLDWQANPASRTIGWNANHLAEILGWVSGNFMAPSWDFAPVGGEPYQAPRLASRREILELFDRNVGAARRAITGVKEEQLAQPWSLMHAGTTILTMARGMALRTYVLNHVIHHRAILCVYLRMNDVAVPGMYDPGSE